MAEKVIITNNRDNKRDNKKGNRLRKEGRLLCKGTGRNALWEKRGNDHPKGGNKRGNI